MRLDWPPDYPNRETLRREARAMADACAEALLALIPREEISCIYWKGSSLKRWDSLVDYVPEMSDVDIHVGFADDAGAARHLGTAEQGIAMQAEIERRYAAKVPRPLHSARPQILSLNALHKLHDYVPSPTETILSLYGANPEAPDYADLARFRGFAKEQLLTLAPAIAGLPWMFVDKPGKHLWGALRAMMWQVAPIAPKLLVLDGVPPMEAWSMNRTALIGRLEWADHIEMAEDYAQFYLHGWRYFLSAWADTDAARAAILAGVRVMREGARLAAQA